MIIYRGQSKIAVGSWNFKGACLKDNNEPPKDAKESNKYWTSSAKEFIIKIANQHDRRLIKGNSCN